MTGIVQSVQTRLTSAFTTSSAGWVLVPGLAATITPLSVANKIILLAKINLASDGSNGVAFKFQRNGVDIDIGDASGSTTQATGCAFGTILNLDSGITVSETLLDSPASVAPQTYQVFIFKGNSADVSVNRGSLSTGNVSNFYRTTSNILLLEYQL